MIFSIKGKEIGGRLIEVIAALPPSDDKDRMSFNRKRGQTLRTSAFQVNYDGIYRRIRPLVTESILPG